MAQIFTMVLDSILIKVRNLATVKEVWEAVCTKHKTKALTIKVDMRCHMYEMKCEGESNVHTFGDPCHNLNSVNQDISHI